MATLACMLASDSCFQQRPTQILFLFLLQLVFWYLGSFLSRYHNPLGTYFLPLVSGLL